MEYLYQIILTWPAITALLLAIGSTIFIFFKAFRQGLMKHYTSEAEFIFLYLKATMLSLLVNIFLLYVAYQVLEPKLNVAIEGFNTTVNESQVSSEQKKFEREFLNEGYNIISDNYFVSEKELDLSQCQNKESLLYFNYLYEEVEKDNADIVICK